MKSGISRLEVITALHIGFLGVLSTWTLGGGASYAAKALSITGSIAPLILFATLYERRATDHLPRSLLLSLWALVGFNVLVLLGTLQPSLRVATIEGGTVYVPRADLSLWPSSARPELALKGLWLFDAIVLSCFNVLVAIRHKRTLRALLLVLAANALLLAVFGSVQKLSSATGLFFGRIASPNSSFFASFIYHNHWGAFAVLMLAVCLGLLFSLRPWSGYRDFWHSPALATVVAVFFLTVTIPLSGSRSCSALAVLLLTFALIHGFRRVARHQHECGKSTTAATVALFLTAAVASGFLFVLARHNIEARMADSQEQFAHMRAEGSIGARAQLYRDTWHMACDRPWFGWGLGSYGTVFMRYNTQVSPADKLPVYYEDAHSDWLQLFAETGAIGISLFAFFLLLPLIQLDRFRQISGLPRYLFAGCGLILAYAWLEFPFGNPAVTLTFWTCYFCAIRWAQLERHEHLN